MSKKEDKIRPLYYRLQAYLAEAPPLDKYMDNQKIWENFHLCIGELNEISGNNYDQFIIQPRNAGNYQNVHIWSDEYRQNLNGLIQQLRAEYFLDESKEEATGGIVINQSQQQHQAIQVQMLLEIQSKIDEKRAGFKDGSKEKGFLDKLKESLSSIKNWADFARSILQTAKDFGLTPDEILNILF